MSCVAAIEADGFRCGSFGYRTFYLQGFLSSKCIVAKQQRLLSKGGSMTIPKRNSLFAVNTIVPLICGLLIYMTKAESTYLSSFLSGFRSLLPTIEYPYIIRSFACDFLWTYSMFFCFRLTLGDKLKGKHSQVVIALTAVVAIVIETIQLFKIIPGTFDPMDILIELIAIAVAFFISTIIERRFKNYEEKCIR
jgi:hypothetical protein